MCKLGSQNTDRYKDAEGVCCLRVSRTTQQRVFRREPSSNDDDDDNGKKRKLYMVKKVCKKIL